MFSLMGIAPHAWKPFFRSHTRDNSRPAQSIVLCLLRHSLLSLHTITIALDPMARSRRTPQSDDAREGLPSSAGSGSALVTETPHFSSERAEVMEADRPAHGLVIFDKDLRVQYVNRQARRMMERDGSIRTEFDPQASLSLHVVKAATKVQEWWHEHPSEPDAELCIQHSFQLRDECVTVTAFGMMQRR